MNAILHKSTNHIFGPPLNWEQEVIPCSNLPATIQVTEEENPADNICVITSYWKPTPEELLLLQAGAFVSLSVCGQTMPPVRLSVER